MTDNNYSFKLDGVNIQDEYDSHLAAYRAMMTYIANLGNLAFKGWHEASVCLWNETDEHWDIEHLIENSAEV